MKTQGTPTVLLTGQCVKASNEQQSQISSHDSVYLYSIPFYSPVCDTSSQANLSQLDLHLKRGGVSSHTWKENVVILGIRYQACSSAQLRVVQHVQCRWKSKSRLTWPMTSRLLNEAELFFTVTLRCLNLSSSRGRSYSNLAGRAKDGGK